MLDHPSKPKPFRFLDIWTRDPNCEGVIQETWNTTNLKRSGTPFVSCIYNTAIALQYWNKHHFGVCQIKIKELENQLRVVHGLEPTMTNLDREREIQMLLDEWLLRLEVLWRQKSRELWLQAGDKNLKFFHASTISNRIWIFIPTIKDENGIWKTTRQVIGGMPY